MKASAHQTAYLPWLGLLWKIRASDVWIDWDDVLPSDGGYENRNSILGADGHIQTLTVPVMAKKTTKIKDLSIGSNSNWQRKHYRSLELAYSKAPGWKAYGPWLAGLYDRKWNRLIDLNEFVLAYLLVQFRLTPRRFKLSELNVETAKNQAIIDACRRVGANKYLFGANGKDYANVPLFHSSGIEPWIQQYTAIEYPQQRPGFVPNLSAFDLLLNVERDRAIEIMMDGGTERCM